MRVAEGGKSECRPVMGRIGIATSSYAKAGRLLLGVSSQELLKNRLTEGKQMNAEPLGMCAFWHDVNKRQVRRLPNSTVKAIQDSIPNKGNLGMVADPLG